MNMRVSLNRLEDDLSSNSVKRQRDAIAAAGALIDMTMLRYVNPEDRPAWPAEFLDDKGGSTRLTDDEIDLLIRALLRMLDGESSIAASAAHSLRNSSRLDALPKLAHALRCWASVSGVQALQAVVAIWDIVTSSSSVGDLSSDDWTMIRQAQSALRFAAENAVEDAASVRKTAQDALHSIEDHLHRADSQRGGADFP